MGLLYNNLRTVFIVFLRRCWMKKKSGKPEEPEKSDKEITLAKIGTRNTLIIALLGVVGTAITAYFGYLSNRQPVTNTLPTDTSLPHPISTILSTPLPTFTPTATIIPTPRLVLDIFGSPPFMRDFDTGYPLIFPSCNCSYRLNHDEDTILVRLRWGAATTELAEQGADLISYSLIVDGNLVSNLNNYRKPAIFVEEPVIDKDAANAWWVYWDIPVTLDTSKSSHLIETELKSLTNIDNGWDVIPGGYVEQFQTSITLFSLEIAP